MVGKVISPATQKPIGDVVDVAAVDRVKRQPVIEGAGIDLPTKPELPVQDTPLAQSLSNQGFDIQPLPRTESQQAAAADFEAGLAPGTGAPAVEPQQQEQAALQREAERVPPLSQRAKIRNNPDKAQESLDRAVATTKFLEDEVSTTPRKGAFGEGDFEAAGFDSETAPARILYDPAAFDAGELSADFKTDRVNPMFGAVAGMVTENFFRNPSSNYLAPGIDFQDRIEFDAEPEVDADAAITEISAAKDNAKLGGQIWEEWMREKAQLDGQPSDTYLLERQKPPQKQLAAMGGLAKHAYARANPDLIEVVPGGKKKGDQRQYQITQEGVDALEESYVALNKPFESYEIPPLNTPTKVGQPQFEAKYRAREQTTATGITDAGPKIDGAKAKYNEMPRMENLTREKLFYTQLAPAILVSIPIVYEATQTDTYGQLTFNIDALSQAPPNLFADAYKVGPARAAGLAQQKVNQIKQLELDILVEDNEGRRKQLEEELENTKKLSPAKMYRQEVMKALEAMNSSARYSNQLLHNTFSTQMLTGRIGIQQNKWNPQNNTMLRFVSGSPNIVSLTPGRSGGAERNFQEAMAAHFINGGTDLHPRHRPSAFAAWKAGRSFSVGGREFAPKVSWAEAVKAGKELKASLAGVDVQAAREVLANLQGGPDIKLGDAIAPLNELPIAEISQETIGTMETIAGKKKSEAPYISDWLMAIADWDTGKPFGTTIEVEVDGITHGMSSNAMALGLEEMALRAGISDNPDLKLTPNDIVIDVTEADINHFVEREKSRRTPSAGPEGHSAELVEYRLAQQGVVDPPNQDGSFSWADYIDKDGTRVDIKMLDPGKKDVWFRDSVQKAKAAGTHNVDVYEFWERVQWPKSADGRNRPLQAGDQVIVRPLGRIRADEAFAQSEVKPFSKGALVYTADNLEPSPHADVAGDVRDKMKSIMYQNARAIAKTVVPSGDPDTINALESLANYAIQDRDNYLKKSPMTMGYGQELESLKMHVKTTINTGDKFKELNDIINDTSNDVDLNLAVDYLHALLINSLEESLNPRVLEVADQLRVNNVLATLTDIPIQYTNPSGFTSSITKTWDVPDSVEQATFKAEGKDVTTPIYNKKYASGSTPRTYQEGGDPVPGGYGHGRIVPTVAQTYDASMMSGIVTGQTGKRLEESVKKRGYEYSFLPVFDAAKVDLAHLDLVRDAMNQEWWKGIKETDYIDKIMGPGGWYDQTLKDFRKRVDALPQHEKVEILPDNEWRGIYWFINDFKHVKKIFDKYHPNKQRAAEYDGFEDTKAFFQGLKAYGINKQKTDPDITSLSPYQLKGVVDEMMNQLQAKQRNSKIASEVKRDRQKLFDKIRAQDILQVDL